LKKWVAVAHEILRVAAFHVNSAEKRFQNDINSCQLLLLAHARLRPLPHSDGSPQVSGGHLPGPLTLSDRLLPQETAESEPLVAAALRARPEARLFGSSTLSDLVFMAGIPALKCGPGRTERSHTPDEFVLESEILDGARFYTRFVRAYAEMREEEAA
jgi:hypothetical protein